ncbi:hypothetical protein G6F55_013512 [Rhizopus delemar]|nr:hypothetical protein G6F55_013512 [Rhizopus delemar]
MEDGALGRLQVAVIARRQRQKLLDLGTRGGDAGVGRAHQLDHVRIALVGHDRTAGGVLRRPCDAAEFGAGEQRQAPGDGAQRQIVARQAQRDRAQQIRHDGGDDQPDGQRQPG